MKVAVQVTEMKKGEDVKHELEGDFVMVAFLKENGDGFRAGSMTLGESFNKKDVLKALGEHMADIIEKLSDNHEEMTELSAAFCASVVTDVMMKTREMEGL